MSLESVLLRARRTGRGSRRVGSFTFNYDDPIALSSAVVSRRRDIVISDVGNAGRYGCSGVIGWIEFPYARGPIEDGHVYGRLA